MTESFDSGDKIRYCLEQIASAMYDKEEAILKRSLKRGGKNSPIIEKNLENVIFKNTLAKAEMKKLSAKIGLKKLKVTHIKSIQEILEHIY